MKTMSRKRKRRKAVAPWSNHGLSALPEYRVWAGMVQRCTNPRRVKYRFENGWPLELALSKSRYYRKPGGDLRVPTVWK